MSPSVPDGTLLRVLTFNVLAPMWVDHDWYAAHGIDSEVLGREARLPKILAVIGTFMPDLVFMQEVQDSVWCELQAALSDTFYITDLARHGHQHWQYYSTSAGDEGNGNCFLIRRGMTDTSKLMSKTCRLSPNGNTAAVAMFELAASCFKICLWNSHLESDDDDHPESLAETSGLRSLQIESLVAEMRQTDACVHIWAGDFNTDASAPEMQTIIEGEDATESLYFSLATKHQELPLAYPPPLPVSIDVVRQPAELQFMTCFDGRYTHPLDNIIVACPKGCSNSAVKVETKDVHWFQGPSVAGTVGQHLTYTLDRYGSDHLPVGATISIVGLPVHGHAL